MKRMDRKAFIHKWGKDNAEFLEDFNKLIENEIIKKHVFVDNGSRPEICSSCRKRIGTYYPPSPTNKRYCPICNERWIF
jgi:hypothetical protein